jgi:Cupin/Helix-turn-helix domain
MMDAVAGLLDGPRARGAFLLRSLLDPPWAFRIEDRAPLTLVAQLRGHSWVRPERAAPFRAAAGDIVVFRGPDAYVMADEPDRAPQAVIGPDQICRPLLDAGRALVDSVGFGVRTWGNSRTGAAAMLTGTYPLHGEVPRTVLARRFHQLVGEPPMTFLTGWRITLAADLLLEPDATIASVAHQVGYRSPFALSTAFKRVRGLTPQQHRTRHRAA